MKTIDIKQNLVIIMMIASSFMLSCKKSDIPVVVSNPPVLTDTGTPAGDISSATIG